VVKFRHNVAIAVAALVAAIGAVPLAATHWLFLPLLVIPLAVAVWGWRAGTDADADGLRIRALLGSRFVPWTGVEALFVGERQRVYARTTRGTDVRLPAVTPADLPRLTSTSSAILDG
jgi:hypothetical protein